MADHHWISELFPMKYTFEDLLKEEENGGVGGEQPKSLLKHKDTYQAIYKRVIISREKEEAARNIARMHDKVDELVSRIGCVHLGVEHTERDSGSIEVKRQTSVNVRELDHCTWTREELNIFRKVFENLKVKAVNLYIVASLANSRIKKLEGDIKEKDKVSSKQERYVYKLKREIEGLQALVKEREQDATHYRSRCERQENEISQHREAILKLTKKCKADEHMFRGELERNKTMLDKTIKEKDSIQGKFEDFQLSIDNTISSLNIKLKKEYESLRQELHAQKEENRALKSAIRSLEQHFIGNQVKKETLETCSFTSENGKYFLNTVDTSRITYEDDTSNGSIRP